MAGPLKISEAASIAFHAVALLVANPKKHFSNKEIAARLHVSEAHLSKVLQRLCKTGILKSIRGPKGGFLLQESSYGMSLLDVFEAIEGPLELSTCLFDSPVCDSNDCVFGGLIESVNELVREYFVVTKLPQLSTVFKEDVT